MDRKVDQFPRKEIRQSIIQAGLGRLNPAKLARREWSIQPKQLLMVEQVFRTMKSVLESRPIYHQADETIRGHVFCSFLALVLRKHLYDAMDSKGFTAEWDDLRRDLDDIEEVEVNSGGKIFVLRTHANGSVGKVFQAAGVGLPPVVRQINS